ncbi:hypothetical protein T07_7238 [Trichinella nelsoni]|uniref:Uncharacterized protein n=1 Tax=Trichinella nelsoni TaxID=6336 RepID=A0A0V0SIF6_9BILA|nr:hypothetical protein T07_7238 [Trichinella nelsoni]
MTKLNDMHTTNNNIDYQYACMIERFLLSCTDEISEYIKFASDIQFYCLSDMHIKSDYRIFEYRNFICNLFIIIIIIIKRISDD